MPCPRLDSAVLVVRVCGMASAVLLLLIVTPVPLHDGVMVHG